MPFLKKFWKDLPDTSTPITASDLNRFENGIADLDQYTWQPRLAKWYASLGDVESAQINHIFIGDSFSEGTGATSLRTRMVGVYQSLMRKKMQSTGIQGADSPYIPAFTPSPLALPVTKTGTTGSAVVGGLGLRILTLSAGATATFTFTGTSGKLAWTAGPAGGRFTVSIDGGTESSLIDAYSANVVAGNLYPIGPLSAGQHTVRITYDSSSPSGRQIFIEGLLTFNGDESRGFRVIDASRHGVQTSEFLSAGSWFNSFRNIGPYALVTIATGHNEASSNVPVATYKANMVELISRLRNASIGNHSGTIQLLFWPKRNVVSDSNLWNLYFAALKEIESGDPDIIVTDMRLRIGDMPTPYNAASGLGLWDGSAHMTDRGQGLSAQVLANALSMR